MKDFLLNELDYFNRIVLNYNTLDKWIDKKESPNFNRGEIRQ